MSGTPVSIRKFSYDADTGLVTFEITDGRLLEARIDAEASPAVQVSARIDLIVPSPSFPGEWTAASKASPAMIDAKFSLSGTIDWWSDSAVPDEPIPSTPEPEPDPTPEPEPEEPDVPEEAAPDPEPEPEEAAPAKIAAGSGRKARLKE